jgi:hypothetical protein
MNKTSRHIPGGLIARDKEMSVVSSAIGGLQDVQGTWSDCLAKFYRTLPENFGQWLFWW